MTSEQASSEFIGTSVPRLLEQMKNEWDSTMLQISQLKKQLEETQQELATALYLNDGAKRVIARLIEERDQLKAEVETLRSASSNSS